MASKQLVKHTELPNMANMQHATFVKHYCNGANYNASEAAKRAGFVDYHQSGWELMQRDDVKQAIRERLAASVMSAPEVGMRLAKIARGAGQYIEVNEYDYYRMDAMGEYRLCGERGDAYVDVSAMKQAGDADLIAKVRQGRNGQSIEFYSMTDALDKVAKIQRLYQDVNLTQNNINVTVTQDSERQQKLLDVLANIGPAMFANADVRRYFAQQIKAGQFDAYAPEFEEALDVAGTLTEVGGQPE